jgi:DNA polymerase I-like protein with 3'-5' exonuclease and polymerase domains
VQLPAFLSNLDPSIYLGDNYVVLDFEVDTSHGDYGAPVHSDNQLLLACWKTGPGHPTPGKSVCQWGGEYEYADLLDDIAKADFLVAHNAKYELGWLRRAGIDLRKVLPFDTKIAEFVLLGNRAAGDDGMKPMSTSLDMCCRRRGLPIKDPVVDTLIGNQINPVRIPQPWLEGRCRQDVDTTEQVFLDQRRFLAETNRLGVLYTRCLLTPVLVDIESEGQALDPERVRVAYEEARDQRAVLEAKMRELTGGINWRSGKQVGEFIYDVLKFEEVRDKRGMPKRNPPTKLNPQGSRKTDQKTLPLLKAHTKEQKEFLKLRKEIGRVNALLSKNLEFFMGIVAEYGGIFYSELNQTSTSTHRLSSTGIPQPIAMFPDKKGKPTWKTAQAQNTPRKLKKLFRAKRKGWLMADPDGSQLEFRVAVELGADVQGMADIADPDWDAHVTSASAMHAVPYDELYARYKAGDAEASEWRQDAKPDTFKPLYGGRKGTKQQERWYDEFRNRYEGIADWQERNIEEVVRTKRLITPWGLRFYWPYAERSRGYVNVTTAVCNYPVQCLATAEIIPIALVYLWHRIGAEGFDDRIRIVNTVHDSAPTEVRPDAVDDFRRLVKQSFTHDVYRYLEVVYGMDFKVPLGVGLKVGEYLGEGKEESYNVWKDGREIRVK